MELKSRNLPSAFVLVQLLLLEIHPHLLPSGVSVHSKFTSEE